MDAKQWGDNMSIIPHGFWIIYKKYFYAIDPNTNTNLLRKKPLHFCILTPDYTVYTKFILHV